MPAPHILNGQLNAWNLQRRRECATMLGPLSVSAIKPASLSFYPIKMLPISLRREPLLVTHAFPTWNATAHLAGASVTAFL